ncbi:uncharacterized protein NESG_00130 [Nematocida ausubeli]|uniref:Uncharacterized protein n=1 Tax=Nematocida ausubeli (strain ATCC PRA-371 / ERTm2) TaxID=1913371 RepID=A0A086J4I9_NEMA1|nr:uncharacterized protein NESG_00130 [Nematocida ausubeli]KFG27057.1 hypothetical protein NESG_00130 [Nematocida ausubeli]
MKVSLFLYYFTKACIKHACTDSLYVFGKLQLDGSLLNFVYLGSKLECFLDTLSVLSSRLKNTVLFHSMLFLGIRRISLNIKYVHYRFIYLYACCLLHPCEYGTAPLCASTKYIYIPASSSACLLINSIMVISCIQTIFLMEHSAQLMFFLEVSTLQIQKSLQL